MLQCHMMIKPKNVSILHLVGKTGSTGSISRALIHDVRPNTGGTKWLALSTHIKMVLGLMPRWVSSGPFCITVYMFSQCLCGLQLPFTKHLSRLSRHWFTLNLNECVYLRICVSALWWIRGPSRVFLCAQHLLKCWMLQRHPQPSLDKKVSV